MAQYCTILSPVDDTEGILAWLREFFADKGRLTVQGEAGDWTSIAVEGGDSSLVINREIFRENGDQFSRVRHGMSTYFEDAETEHEEVKAEVIRRIEAMALALGVVAEPAFDEDAGHFEAIFGLAETLNALIWNGSGVLNAEGELVLNGDGESETAGGDDGGPA